MPKIAKFALCIFFLLAAAFGCYRRPVFNLDRYFYEAIVRGKSQSIEVIYNIVKHENPRAEASPVLDSPEHLRELERLFAVRPLYLKAISVLSNAIPIQDAITLISAASLFGMGIVVLSWTKKPLQTALLMAAYQVLSVGRLGTPDALASLLCLAGLWLIEQNLQRWFGLVLLFVSLGVRTDNVLLILLVLTWMAWSKNSRGCSRRCSLLLRLAWC